MTIKLKVFGIVALAATALSSLMFATASATTGGHFTSASAHTTLSGSEGGEHTTKLFLHDLGTIQCLNTSYSATVNASTVTEVTITPSYGTCQTTGGTHGVVSVAMNECDYVVKIGKLRKNNNTVSLVCPAEKAITVTHSGCTLKVLPQSMTGVVYTTDIENGRHILTVEVAVTLNVQRHGGICIFVTTNGTATLSGAIRIKGANAEGTQVGITATGSEDVPSQEFRSEVSHTGLTGTQTTATKTTFGVLLGNVECSGMVLDGTMAASKVGAITVKPAYTGCSGSGREVTTHSNGCAYVLTVSEAGTDGVVEVECPAGKAIETTVDKFPEGCTLTIGPQAAGGVVDLKEEGSGSGRDLLLTWTLEGVTYERDGCEVGGTGHNGTMSGSVTLSGEDTSGNPKGIWIE